MRYWKKTLCAALAAMMILMGTACDMLLAPIETVGGEGTAPSVETSMVGTDEGHTEMIETTQEPTTEIDTEIGTETEVSLGTEVPGETETPVEDVTAPPEDTEFDPARYVVIKNAEDLMNFNREVNEEYRYCNDMTVVILDDIDMTGHTWTPLNGDCLKGVTFEGYGHTISNLRFVNHAPDADRPATMIGSGLVSFVITDMTFRNLTIDTATVTAYERAVGCFVGVQTGGDVSFENCTVRNFAADGWMDYKNQDEENGGHPIAFRLAGFVGCNMGGTLYFQNCHVENVELFGFHNMAGFVGYAFGGLDEYSFENCSVKNLQCTFSYCMASSYVVDMPRKFVSVFYNHHEWVDKVGACVEQGNTFENVRYYDWSDDNTEYNPDNFASWSQEECEASKNS